MRGTVQARRGWRSSDSIKHVPDITPARPAADRQRAGWPVMIECLLNVHFLRAQRLLGSIFKELSARRTCECAIFDVCYTLPRMQLRGGRREPATLN